MIPQDNPSDKDVNQGTLVVFNLDASVSNDDLRQIFGVYGEVKEVGHLTTVQRLNTLDVTPGHEGVVCVFPVLHFSLSLQSF